MSSRQTNELGVNRKLKISANKAMWMLCSLENLVTLLSMFNVLLPRINSVMPSKIPKGLTGQIPRSSNVMWKGMFAVAWGPDPMPRPGVLGFLVPVDQKQTSDTFRVKNCLQFGCAGIWIVTSKRSPFSLQCSSWKWQRLAFKSGGCGLCSTTESIEFLRLF